MRHPDVRIAASRLREVLGMGDRKCSFPDATAARLGSLQTPVVDLAVAKRVADRLRRPRVVPLDCCNQCSASTSRLR